MHGGDRLGRHDADDDAADQAGTAGGGDAGELAPADARLPHRAGDQSIEVLQMGARGDLRHHAAIRAMFLELRQHEVAEDAPVGGDNRRRRLVATRLDAENDHAKCSLTRAGLTVALPIHRGHISTTCPTPLTRASRLPLPPGEGRGEVPAEIARPPGEGWSQGSFRKRRVRVGRRMSIRGIRIGTRGSPLALAQTEMARARIVAASPALAGPGAAGSRGDPHYRRQGIGPAARRHRRQGAVQQGDRRGDAGRRDRSGRAFGEGPADLASRRPRRWARCCRARIRATC